MSEMADVLAAATLLVTAVTLAFATWEPAIEAALKAPNQTSPGGLAKQLEQLAVLRTRRALPVAAVGWATLAAFAPRDLSILGETAGCLGSTACRYSDVAVVFLLTQCALVLLTAHVTRQAELLRLAVRRVRTALDPPARR